MRCIHDILIWFIRFPLLKRIIQKSFLNFEIIVSYTIKLKPMLIPTKRGFNYTYKPIS